MVRFRFLQAAFCKNYWSTVLCKNLETFFCGESNAWKYKPSMTKFVLKSQGAEDFCTVICYVQFKWKDKVSNSLKSLTYVQYLATLTPSFDFVMYLELSSHILLLILNSIEFFVFGSQPIIVFPFEARAIQFCTPPHFTLLTPQQITMTSLPSAFELAAFVHVSPLCSGFRRAHVYDRGTWRSLQLPSAWTGTRRQLRVHQHARLRTKTHTVVWPLCITLWSLCSCWTRGILNLVLRMF